MSEKIIPLGDNVVLEIVEQQKTRSGLYIPDKARGNQRDAILAKVRAVGPGRVSEYGVKMEVHCKVGDYVLLPRAAGVEIELSAEDRGRERLRIVRDIELLGAVEESRIIQLGLVTP